MSFYVIKPKQTVVKVIRSTRGKFPGERSPKGTLGVVWSSWVANSAWGTEKMSILDADGNVTFTTKKCTEVVGEISEHPLIEASYRRHADEHFLPVFVQIKDVSIKLIKENTKQSFRVKYLGRSNFSFIPLSSVHPDDANYIIKNPEEQVYSLRAEPWVLRKHGVM